MKVLKKTISVLLSVVITMSVLFVGGISASAEASTYLLSDLAGKYKTQGRTALVDGSLMLDWSVSGIEWTADCSGDVSVKVNTTQLDSTSATGGLYFTVLVDGVAQSADIRIPTDNGNNWSSNSTGYPFHITALGESEFVIAKNLPKGEHTFAIYRQTEANMGAFGIKSITLDGGFSAPKAANDLYVEFVGDSITAGHGNISTTSQNAALYEDATRGWAYLAANKLNADWSVIAVSGITAIDGIGWGGANSASMPDVYPYQRYYSDKTTAYSFNREPDVIVLGLGTNDSWTWDGANYGGPLSEVQKLAGFKDMLALLRSKNPNAKIVWIHGMMSSVPTDYITKAISDMGGAENGYYSLALKNDRTGGNGHPGLAVQTEYAEAVSAFITKITENSVDDEWEVPTSKPDYIGSGTSADPYHITNGTELYWAVNNENDGVHFKLYNDIVLNEMTVDVASGTVSSTGDLKSWYTGGAGKYFSGTLDGNGHVIKGLYIDSEYTGSDSEWNIGYALISRTKNAVIKNLGIENSFVKAPGATAAAFIGSIGNVGANPQISGCYIGKDVYLYGNQAGGFIGSGNGGSLKGGILNCYSIATIKAKGNYFGAIYGGVWSCGNNKVENCFATTKLYGNNQSVCVNCYSPVEYTGCTKLTAEQMRGMDGQLNLKGLSQSFCITGDDYPTLKLFAGRTSGEWSGFRNDKLDGDGIDSSPFLIDTAEQLAHVIYSGGKGFSYRLTSDIYLNNINKFDWSTGLVNANYSVAGWYSTAFNGKFDGDGHIVYGLYINKTVNRSAWGGTGDALIPVFSAGTVENVGVDYSFIQATNNAAAIVGLAQRDTVRYIKQCFAGDKVTTIGFNASGIYGSGDANITISDCYSLATVKGIAKSGGISGGWWSYKYNGVSTTHKISNCYTIHSKAYNSATSAVACFENVKTYGDASINNAGYWSLGDAYVRIGNNYPTLKIFTDLPQDIPWNGLGDDSYIVDNAGTAQNPYIIKTAAQLAHAIYNNGNGKYYKLANDIYLNVVSKDWTSRKDNIVWLINNSQHTYGHNNSAFVGYIDGNGYTVQGIYYPDDNSGKTAALVPAFAGGYIKNIGIKNSQIISAINSGGIIAVAAKSSDDKEVSGCFVDDSVYIEFTDNTNPGGAGGIIGYANCTSDYPLKISNCYSSAALVSAYAADQRSNGIVGISWNAYYTVDNCYSVGYKPYHATGTNTVSFTKDAYHNVYTDSSVKPVLGAYTNLSKEQLTGSDALKNLSEFSDDVWYAVSGDKTPMLRIYGKAIGDVDEDGSFVLAGDAEALRNTLIGKTTAKNSDVNRNNVTDICDLVSLHKK